MTDSTYLARAAEAMLRALGGEPITLVFPVVLTTTGNDNELGLGTVTTEEVSIAPAVVHALAPTDGRVRRELWLPANAIAALAEARGAASGEGLLRSAVGVSYQGRMLLVESVTPELFGGRSYFYRVIAASS